MDKNLLHAKIPHPLWEGIWGGGCEKYLDRLIRLLYLNLRLQILFSGGQMG